MLAKILAGLAALSSFASAILIVLLKKAKAENEKAEIEAQRVKAEADQIEAMRKAENAVHKSIAEQEAENEELVKRANAANNLDSFNAGLDLLRKQSENGDKRNTRASSARA